MKSITVCWLSCLALASTMSAASAQPLLAKRGVSASAAASVVTAVAATPASVPAIRGPFDKPAEAATLDTYRGGSVLVKNDMRLAGTTAGNTADHVVTGANSIDSGSFANMGGLAVSIQNSGANVLIQNAVILNLQMN